MAAGLSFGGPLPFNLNTATNNTARVCRDQVPWEVNPAREPKEEGGGSGKGGFVSPIPWCKFLPPLATRPPRPHPAGGKQSDSDISLSSEQSGTPSSELGHALLHTPPPPNTHL